MFGVSPMSIRALPERFGDLTSLEDLNMKGCTSVLSLPESFCRLSSLKKLDLSGDEQDPMNLESLPERFGQLRSLVTLNLRACKQLRALPAGTLPPSTAPAVVA